MKFSLIFDNSGDALPFEVKYNHELLEFFVDHSNKNLQNSFGNDQELYRLIDKRITHLHWAVSKTNEVLHSLIDESFDQHNNLENYLDQKFLNQLHASWVFSQNHNIDINTLCYSSDRSKAEVGYRLHKLYPDDIPTIKTAEAMTKLGYLYPYEEVNMGVHRIEGGFAKLEFKADKKWEVFENPYKHSLITNNDVVNFSFGYTYVGRQYYNKFRYFDSKLECSDHYNYETLEFGFQLSLSRPETVPFSIESQNWAKEQNVDLVAEQIPIANLIGLEDNLFDYRKILYRNSRDNNRAKIILH